METGMKLNQHTCFFEYRTSKYLKNERNYTKIKVDILK